MKCKNCGERQLVKNGKSRHGNQRWVCKACGKTAGEFDRRKIIDEIRQAALDQYLEGKGLRATERVVGVSHNAVMEWVYEAAKKNLTIRAKPDSLEWVDTKTLIKQAKDNSAHSSGIVIVLPKKFAAGQWAVLVPKNPAVWMRNFIKSMVHKEIWSK